MNLTTDPIWPWSTPGYGTPLLLLAALLLGGLTVWTYLGVTRVSARRVFIVLCLRFGALLLAILALIRPALASRNDLNVPSVLFILLDRSESMTFHDEYGGLSRWEALQRILEKGEPTLQELRDRNNVTIVVKCFAEDLADYDPQRPADGKRTDFGTALNKLLAEYRQERFLRGLIILSDGGNNCDRPDPIAEAEQWRRRPCPIYTFAFGQTTAPPQQRDIAITKIVPPKAAVPVKNKFAVTVSIDAAGFENTLVPVRLFVDDKEVDSKEERLTKATGNEVQLSAFAPDKPGEIKLTVKVDKQIGETNLNNNEISTFVTVTKEGLSVLYVEGKFRAWEPKYIKEALKDPRIRLVEMVRPTDGPLSNVRPREGVLSEDETFRFEQEHYDVIILGDISAHRLSGGEPTVLARIRDEVVKRGTGLMMIGGFETFGNSDWKDTPIAAILPVESDAFGQDERDVRMVPTKQGLDRYLMRLDDDPKKNQALWDQLPKLHQFTKMGKERLGAIVLARANDPVMGAPLLVSREVGAGRTLAFAADTTWHWRNLGLLDKPPTKQGEQLHARFWRQVALWLAKQEEMTGNVWARPDERRLPAGLKQGITVGLHGKGGADLPDAQFTVKVIDPAKGEHVVATSREAAGERGVFVKTEQPGEYRIVVNGKGKDTDGKQISGTTTVRFLTYQDTIELSRPAADHDFLARLANSGGGKALRADELPRFLQELRNQPPPMNQRAHTETWPDWHHNQLSGFLPVFFLVFVAVLSVEWFLRRTWGLV